MGNVYVTAETKSENESYAMLRITNATDSMITIKDISSSVDNEEFNMYLKFLIGLSILPNSSYRFYVTGEDSVNPPEEEFDISLSWLQDDKVGVKQQKYHISFMFRNMFREYRENERVLLSDPNRNADKQKWEYYSLLWDLKYNGIKYLEEIIEFVYTEYRKHKEDVISSEDIEEIVKEFLHDYKDILNRVDKGLEKEIVK